MPAMDMENSGGTVLVRIHWNLLLQHFLMKQLVVTCMSCVLCFLPGIRCNTCQIAHYQSILCNLISTGQNIIFLFIDFLHSYCAIASFLFLGVIGIYFNITMTYRFQA